jgi:hypothetical protein
LSGARLAATLLPTCNAGLTAAAPPATLTAAATSTLDCASLTTSLCLLPGRLRLSATTLPAVAAVASAAPAAAAAIAAAPALLACVRIVAPASAPTASGTLDHLHDVVAWREVAELECAVLSDAGRLQRRHWST